jgi:hypothetical protein
VVSLALIVGVAVSPVWAVGDKVRSDKAAGPAGEDGVGDPQVSRGIPVGENVQILSVQEDMNGKEGQSGTTQILNAEEEDAFLKNIDKKDIIQVFSNLLEGSESHLEAFESHL